MPPSKVSGDPFNHRVTVQTYDVGRPRGGNVVAFNVGWIPSTGGCKTSNWLDDDALGGSKVLLILGTSNELCFVGDRTTRSTSGRNRGDGTWLREDIELRPVSCGGISFFLNILPKNLLAPLFGWSGDIGRAGAATWGGDGGK